MNYTTGAIIAHCWQDATVNVYANDCMLIIQPGVYFHHRIQCVIVIKSELSNAVANALPTTA